mgnify:CR=1 FL=1
MPLLQLQPLGQVLLQQEVGKQTVQGQHKVVSLLLVWSMLQFCNSALLLCPAICTTKSHQPCHSKPFWLQLLQLWLWLRQRALVIWPRLLLMSKLLRRKKLPRSLPIRIVFSSSIPQTCTDLTWAFASAATAVRSRGILPDLTSSNHSSWWCFAQFSST